MDLGEIETFLALAEELHFGRTAQRLRLSQSRVSQQIQSLERRLGAPLFTRTSRRVELTRLGEHTRDGLGAAYQALGQAFDEARTVAQGVVGTLRIGFLGCLNGAPLTTLAADFAAAHPACRISLAEVPWTDLYGQLRGGELDLVLSLLPVAEPDLRFGPVLVGHDRVLAVAVDHPLAAAATVDAEQLADYPVLALPAQLPTALRLSAQPPVTPRGRPIRPQPSTGGPPPPGLPAPTRRR